ncbi:MAG: 50S ribosomal protein L3 [bacterium]
MSLGLLGRKLGMSQVFDKDGKITGVTVIEAGPCYVIRNKTEEKDGYQAVQVGYKPVKESKLNKPLLGHLKKNGAQPLKYLHEFRLNKDETTEVGTQLKIDTLFKNGDFVDIAGKSRGKGFAGCVKRYGFKGGKASRGSMFHRAPGSIGANTFPGRVWKGKKLPGHMGDAKVTTIGLYIVNVDADNNLIMVKGSIAGAPGGLIVIQKSKRNKRVKIIQKAIEDKKGKRPTAKK